MKQKRLLLATTIALASGISAQAQYDYTQISVPGSDGYVQGVSGDKIYGEYVNGGNYDSFIYDNGILQTGTIKPAGATSVYLSGMSGNNAVGYYYTAASGAKGYLYNGSTYTTLSAPTADYTYATSISGNLVAGYLEGTAGGYQSFLYDVNNASYTILDLPSSGQVFGINGNNVVGQSGLSGFIFNFNTDVYTELNVPGSTYTTATGIYGNDIVGTYGGSDGNDYGFIFDGSVFTTLDIPGAQYAYPNGISDDGRIAGYYYDTDGNLINFVGTPTATPEPSSLALIGFGLVSGHFWMRRRRMAAHLPA